MNKKISLKSELLSISYGELFNLSITVDFHEYGDFYILKSEKMKLKIESTSNDLQEAKNEFVSVLFTYLDYQVKNKKIFNTLEKFKFKIKHINEIYAEFQKNHINNKHQNNSFNKFQINPDIMLSEKINSLSEEKLNTIWSINVGSNLLISDSSC